MSTRGIETAFAREKEKVKVLEDMLEQKMRDIYLEKEEHRTAHDYLKGLLEAMDSGLIVTDENLIITKVNSSTAIMLGIPEQALCGKSIDEILPETKRFRDLVIPSNRDTNLRIQTSLVSYDGRKIPVQLSVRSLRSDQGDFCGLVCVAHDRTEEKNLEMHLLQAQKLESIGQLAAGIAHEINTPIQFIGDNTRFLLDAFKDLIPVLDGLKGILVAADQSTIDSGRLVAAREAVKTADLEYLHDEIPKAIEQTLEGVARVSRIVRAMKEFSHPGSEQLQAIDINKLIESTCVVSTNEWKYVAELTTDFDPSLPLVSCLPGEFNQVCLNLIVNAAHAIEDVKKETNAKGQIKISTRKDGDWVEVRISDTGSGIPEAIRSKIFDPFFTTKSVGKGTGQGLTLAYTVITEKHRGTITFESTVGKGTTFIVRLPIIELLAKQ